MEAKRSREPFPGAYYVGLAITLVVLYFTVALASGMPPGLGGFFVALFLGLTVNPRYAVIFLVIGLVSVILGALGQESEVAWGGVGLALAQVALLFKGTRRP